MKVKHIISACGILLGGIVVAQSASAKVTYKSSADVQFTFNSSLTLSLAEGTAGAGTDFVITDLAPGNSKLSNQVNVVVNTNNASGYTVGATVGSSEHASTDLELSQGNVFSMTSDTSLTAGKWGYTLNGNAGTPTYFNLPLYTSTPKTIITSDAPSASGGDATPMWIGAYAASDQLAGTYQNVVNFVATAKVSTYTLTAAKGTNVASVTVTPSATSYEAGATVQLTATCSSGYTFNNWVNSTDYGSITSPTSSTTNFVVGEGNTTVTAYCK